MAAGSLEELKQCPWHTWSLPQPKCETPNLSQRGTLRQFLDEQNTSSPLLVIGHLLKSVRAALPESFQEKSVMGWKGGWDGEVGMGCLKRVLISLVTSHEVPVSQFFTCGCAGISSLPLFVSFTRFH